MESKSESLIGMKLTAIEFMEDGESLKMTFDNDDSEAVVIVKSTLQPNTPKGHELQMYMEKVTVEKCRLI
jgi:hypothetical protein